MCDAFNKVLVKDREDMIREVWAEALRYGASVLQESTTDQKVRGTSLDWGKGNILFDTLTSKGFNLTGQSSWDGVEFHLRIFGHLPEKETCGVFSCAENGARQKMGDFIHDLVEHTVRESKTRLLEEADKAMKDV